MQNLRTPYFRYLVVVSCLGMLLFILGIIEFVGFENKFDFLLFVLLAAVAQVASNQGPSKKVEIFYSVSTAVAVAAIPVFGYAAAAVIEVIASFTIWLIRPVDEAWKRSWSQLSFNSGMNSIAIFTAGWVFHIIYGQITNEILQLVVWPITAVVYEQVNLWLLIGILRLQRGNEINPWTVWKENSWATRLNIIFITVGGGLLAFAQQRFGTIGISTFFLPIFLSNYAYRLYAQQMQEHLDNLEHIIKDRTGDLALAVEELEHLNEELSDVNQELEVKNKEKDAFLAVLTHDMKSPLASINIYASLLKEYPDLLTKKPHIADVILRSQQNLLEIVNNILDLENIQANGSMPLNKDLINLSQIVDAVAVLIEAQALEKNIRFEWQYNSPDIILNADRMQLERVLLNVVSNAIKYTPENGQVWLKVISSEGMAIVSVQDTGYGIPADEIPYVFDRFRRIAKHKDKAAGTGLGLAITKALVEAHDGQIEVFSEEHSGSTFIIKLPLHVTPVS